MPRATSRLEPDVVSGLSATTGHRPANRPSRSKQLLTQCDSVGARHARPALGAALDQETLFGITGTLFALLSPEGTPCPISRTTPRLSHSPASHSLSLSRSRLRRPIIANRSRPDSRRGRSLATRTAAVLDAQGIANDPPHTHRATSIPSARSLAECPAGPSEPSSISGSLLVSFVSRSSSCRGYREEVHGSKALKRRCHCRSH